MRVQFWKGFSRKYVIGTMSRRLSQSRTTTYVRLISSISPNSPSTTI